MILLLIIFFGIIYALYNQDKYINLLLLVYTNILLISYFGFKEISFFSQITNVGSIFHALALYTMSIILIRFGKIATINVVNQIGMMLIFLTLISGLVFYFPVVQGNETINLLLFNMYDISVRVRVASFLSFYFVNYFFIYFYELLNRKGEIKSIILSVIIAQLLDSMVFFTIAFMGVINISNVLMFMITGFLFKLSIHLLTFPFYRYICKF